LFLRLFFHSVRLLAEVNMDQYKGEFDTETSKWMAEIDSFRSPPPPRKLFGSDLLLSSDTSVLPSVDQCVTKKHDNGKMTNNRNHHSECVSNAKFFNKSYSSDHSDNFSKLKYADQPKKVIASSMAFGKKLTKNVMDEDEIGKLNEAVRRACRPTVTDQTATNSVESSRTTIPISRNGNILDTDSAEHKPTMVHDARHHCNLYDVPSVAPVSHQTVKDYLPQNSVPLQSFPIFSAKSSQEKNGSLDMGPAKALIGPKALEAQQRKFLQFEAEIAQQLEQNEPIIGNLMLLTIFVDL